MERHGCPETEGCSSTEIPREILQEIIVKLPTRDVARCCCVSRMWCSAASDPDFRNHHGATYVAPLADTQLLLVTERRAPGWADEASVFNVSSGKPMCDITIPRGYTFANICNGFLCFVHGAKKTDAEAPVVVCNPVTGEKLTLPKCPPAPNSARWYVFALGYSPSTNKYKMFRLDFWPDSYGPTDNVYLHVHTLGTAGGYGEWRQYSYNSESRPLRNYPPLYIDGKIYVLTSGSTRSEDRRLADRMLELDVATERRRMYRLPYPSNQYHWSWDPLVDTFEMNGQLCLAVNIIGDPPRKIQFWVLSPPPDDKHLDDQKLYWDLRFSFHVDGKYFFNNLTAAWVDDGRILCYRDGDTLYTYDTTKHSVSPCPMAKCLPCDQQLQLPATPPSSFESKADKVSRCQWDVSWDIYCGYRPTLLSPLALSLPPRHDASDEDHRYKLAQDVLQIVRRR